MTIQCAWSIEFRLSAPIAGLISNDRMCPVVQRRRIAANVRLWPNSDISLRESNVCHSRQGRSWCVKPGAFDTFLGVNLTHRPLESLKNVAAFQADDEGSIPFTRSNLFNDFAGYSKIFCVIAGWCFVSTQLLSFLVQAVSIMSHDGTNATLPRRRR